MTKVEQKVVPLNGDNAVAFAVKQCDVDVVAQEYSPQLRQLD